jgi:SAM-dependent methyltransferase
MIERPAESEAMVLGPSHVDASTDAERAQKEHYNRIAATYQAQYDDPFARRYRDEYLEQPMLNGLDLSGRQVLEAMCGSGMTTAALLSRGAQVTGIDISEACIESFQARWPQCRAVCGSITSSGMPAGSFDAVVVVGGLHHLQPDVHPAIDEIHRLLRVGGSLSFMEPHTGSLADLVRRQWYKRDLMFGRNEAAIDVDGLKRTYADRFEFVHEVYGGNLGFLLVFNSVAFRIPLRLKPLYSPVMLRVEALIRRFQGKRSSCFVVCQWRKK